MAIQRKTESSLIRMR